MKIYLDDRSSDIPPDGVSWEFPQVLGHDGQGAPIYAPYYACGLSFERLTCIKYDDWRQACDGELHTVRLPHPTSGTMTNFTCYLESVRPRHNIRDACLAAASGVDVRLIRIVVS